MSASMDNRSASASQLAHSGVGADVCADRALRRCLACRSRADKRDLLRFAVLDGVLLFDLRSRVQSRGYYVCANRSCLSKVWKGKLAHAVSAEVDCGILLQDIDHYIDVELCEALWRRYREIFLSGAKSSALLTRVEQVEGAAIRNELKAYVLATDAGRATRQKYVQNARRKGVNCYGLLSKDVIGRLLGCGPRSVLGWRDGALFCQFESLELKLTRLTGVASAVSQMDSMKPGDETRE